MILCMLETVGARHFVVKEGRGSLILLCYRMEALTPSTLIGMGGTLFTGYDSDTSFSS